jgi:hypothetical protein
VQSRRGLTFNLHEPSFHAQKLQRSPTALAEPWTVCSTGGPRHWSGLNAGLESEAKMQKGDRCISRQSNLKELCAALDTDSNNQP